MRLYFVVFLKRAMSDLNDVYIVALIILCQPSHLGGNKCSLSSFSIQKAYAFISYVYDLKD